jgi:hypothetical protein
MPFENIINDKHSQLSPVQVDKYLEGSSDKLLKDFLNKYGDDMLMDLSQSGSFNHIEAKDLDEYKKKATEIVKKDAFSMALSFQSRSDVSPDEIKYQKKIYDEYKRLENL